MKRLRKLLFRLAVVAGLWFLFLHFAETVQRPVEEALRRPVPDARQALTPREKQEALERQARRRTREALPRSSSRDPAVQVEMAPCADACTGTAFAIDNAGHWLTALHVVDQCSEIGLLDRGRIRPVKEVLLHPAADIGLLRTDFSAPPLKLNDAVLQRRQDGFHFGFPRAEPGAVHGQLIGRLRLRATGQRRFVAPAIAWAEVSRIPDNDKPLGGLSGGAVLDEAGAVIGVAVAASERRGRVISAAPRSIGEMLQLAGVTPDGSRARRLRGGVTDGNYGQVGQQLRRALSVAQVVCRAPAYLKKRRPRAR